MGAIWLCVKCTGHQQPLVRNIPQKIQQAIHNICAKKGISTWQKCPQVSTLMYYHQPIIRPT